ncbi:ankyrin repeat domain-containing protein 6-like isoform X2 [Xyrichtys novacula]|uniref:Ankyrin repeat domain-containing protein 6-like isoform X2 n=1 Tax=Xyrichtys novacula TaxID=13765 RepID=A0AAV1GL82_XYRNO|nr:ankyrin repeat domain-containing protein 6-like isoform X2 [Xyrichtys novacula]
MAALIQGGCAVDLQDGDGNTALHEVSWHGFSHCVKLLTKAGADIHIRNKAGNTALHLACQNAHAQTARLLLLEGSKPDTKNIVGDTCLHVAARYDNLTLVKILLSSLCSVTQRNQSGDTALHVAAALNHKRTVELLLEAGTDGKIRNNAGKTALDSARDHSHKDVALLLARAPQVHRFMRKTIKKRRAERRTQSDPREDKPPNKDDSSGVEETHSSERNAIQVSPYKLKKQKQRNHKTPAAVSIPCSPRQRRRVQVQAVNRDDDQRKRQKNLHSKRDQLCEDDDNEDSPALNGKTYQLYTLYRDKDGNIRQAPVDGCHCQPLLQKLEVQLKATQEEMRLHILNIQEQVSCRLGQMDRRNRHQIKVLDILNQERAAAERRNMIYRMEQRVAQGREETLMTQAAVSHELKRWCLSQLKEVQAPTKTKYYKLLPSPSVEQCAGDAELESFPLLSVRSGDSSTSLATYVNILPSRSSHSPEVLEPELNGGKTYFEMKVDRSPDDYQNTALFPLPAQSTSGLLLGSVDPLWQPPRVQDSPTAPALCGEGFYTSSTSWTSISDQAPRLTQHQDKSFSRNLTNTHRQAGLHAEGTRTLEFFTDHPAEPTFVQERNNLHAKEVTQRFFETVSIQLERWYERKVVEVERQTALRSQQDRDELLQRINALEEELRRLRTNESTESLKQPDSD